jgi:hypothetical protein
VSSLHYLFSESLGEAEAEESCSQASQLIVRLRQPFDAFLLAQEWGGEYERITSDQDIIVQVKDMASVNDMMHVGTLKIS